MTYINDQTFNNKHKESEVEITYDIGFNKATKSFPTSTTWAAVFDKCGITTEHLSKIRFRGVGGARINTPVLYETLASCESRRISIDYGTSSPSPSPPRTSLVLGGLVGGAPKRLREDDEDEDEDEPNAPRIKCARTTSPGGSSTATNALATSSAAPRAAMLALADATLALSQKLVQPQKNEEDSDSNEDVRLLQTMPVESQEGGFADEFKRVADNIVTLLAAVCSSSAPRLAPLALLLLANRCEAAGTVCHNSKYSSLCDGTFTGTEVVLY
eukprot:CAMPEP_0185368220 /NCGR_PEP_ID=MMETSP1364-20130426/14869_1 /TAXON_ID=38817 /ORGANISM="Gephyrocapsa oceanica, Strain RCC1303" /LENGTH=271 /DNA_ID=CAMNT_0027968889 /DNA_START=11 /DNA_END=823 /DNA_ORIENTATION=+